MRTITTNLELQDKGEYLGYRIFVLHQQSIDLFSNQKEDWFEWRIFKDEKFICKDVMNIDGSYKLKSLANAYNDAKLNIESGKRTNTL